jgi:NAD(P)H-flavin reductase
MHLVLRNDRLSPNVHRLEVEAARIAEIHQPGQFVIVRKGAGAERIPLTIADSNREKGSITLVIQAVGISTQELVAIPTGDTIQDIAGPLGHPT